MRDENQVKEFDYWTTILEQFMADVDIPLQVRRKIELAKPLQWINNTLYLTHPEPEWMNQRIARKATNLIQGLAPGAQVRFAAG